MRSKTDYFQMGYMGNSVRKVILKSHEYLWLFIKLDTAYNRYSKIRDIKNSIFKIICTLYMLFFEKRAPLSFKTSFIP